ncbi:MAG TPA: pilus assembly protein TadG-related protein [Pyrinomonadaceae bacterium]
MNQISLSTTRHSERGNVVVYTVLSALFLFFAVGLGVDLSHLYLVKTELQNAADAGALAAASALGQPDTQRITSAVDRAISTMNLNKYNFNNKNFSDVMDTTAQRALVTFAVNLGGPYISEAAATANSNTADSIRFVRLRTPSVSVNTFFATPLLGSTQSLNATATSGRSVPGNVRFCPAPLSAVSCDPGDQNCQLASNFQGTCPGANPHAIQTYPDGTTCDPTRQFCKACTYTIRSAPSTGPSPGNYNILDCGQGNGGSADRDALANYGAACQCGNVSPGDTITTKPGVTAGPIRQGLNVRFDVYGGGISYSTSTPPDTNIAQTINWTQYKAGSPFTAPSGSHVGITDRRVLIIPIIPISQFGNGRTQVQVGSMGGFFMQQQVANGNGGDIQAEYVGNDLIGVVGFDPNGGAASNVVTVVLYR